MIFVPQNAALIVIDVQKGFDDPQWGSRNNPDAEEVIASLLEVWRETARPVFHVQHLSHSESSPLHPQRAGCELKELVRPLASEQLIQKRVNSAFIGTELESKLRQMGIETLVLVGLTTPHCVSTSARMAGNLGFTVYLPSDAIAAFEITGPDRKWYSAEEVHSMSLAALHGEFATVVDAKALLHAVRQPAL